ncbi:MAG: hypothetical protein ABSC25_02105 [Roseiarcus sp.]
MTLNGGYADIFKACGDEAKIALIPTTEELEAAYNGGRECEGATRLVRGRLRDIYCSSADLLWKSIAFRPDAAGLLYFADPFYDGDGRIVDLVVTGGGHDDDGEGVETASVADWFWSTGIADALGKENLGKITSADSPLLAYFGGPEAWREDDWQGVAVLKPSAKRLLTRAAFVRLDHWDYVSDFAEEFFPENMGAVSGPDDAEAYAGCLERRAIAEIQRTKPRPFWLASPLEWMEARRIFRGGHPGEPLPAELRI